MNEKGNSNVPSGDIAFDGCSGLPNPGTNLDDKVIFENRGVK
ncbi:hypothetical protein [Microbulbifer variabilis]|nr:hypothetical protein [Microbulbifer variabilis]